MTRMKKQAADSGRDRHLSQAMVRLPGDVHRQLKTLAGRNNRPLTREITAVLVKHLEQHGLWPPGAG
jgi:phage host-nuclease inhibitor protein Gam